MRAWHTISTDNIFAATKTTAQGLTSTEAEQRLRQSGPNILPSEPPLSRVRLFLAQFHSPLMYVLLSTVVISLFLKHYSDSIFIIIVLLINTTVGFYQENKTNNSLRALKGMVKITARVTRDGYLKEIDSEELVAGDVVSLVAGDKVPADGRLTAAKNMKINEASLTGEWLASAKNATDSIAATAPLANRKNMVFMGTIVEEGRGNMVVVAVGADTQIGEIVTLLRQTHEGKTPLQRKIASLSRLVGAFVLSLIGLVIILGYFTEKSFTDIFVAALALAVSAIPAGLLPAITVILVLGMRRILQHKGLVRKLSASETLGNVTVICTDKTGTLTEGSMQVSHILTGTRELTDGQWKDVAHQEKLNGLESHIVALKIAVVTSSAFIENPDAAFEEWVVRGRPTERALLLAGMHAGVIKKELEQHYTVIDELPFDSDRKYAATLLADGNKQRLLYVLGAPEVLIAQALHIDVDGRHEKLATALAKQLLRKLEVLTAQGLRVVACAYRTIDADKSYHQLTDAVEQLTLVGFIALKDPVRSDVAASLATTHQAGIRTLIVTGDHQLTARAIANELGFTIADNQIIEGPAVDALDDAGLRQQVKTAAIYARVSPRHKLRIVNALQANNEVVAMVGDGVNDSPALKQADVGVAVGNATDVAKEVADIILLDNSFTTIVKAIEQGRIMFENIRKVFTYLVADDFSELFLFIGSMAMGLPIPLLPAQILWINLIEDGLPDIALTMEQEANNIMRRKPRRPDEPILHPPLRRWMTSIFFISGLAALLSFVGFWYITDDLRYTRTAVFALIGLDSLVFAFCVRSFSRTVFRRDIFSNRFLTVAVIVSAGLLAAAIYLPVLQKILSTQPLQAMDWLVIAGISLVELVLIEISKKRIFGVAV